MSNKLFRGARDDSPQFCQDCNGYMAVRCHVRKQDGERRIVCLECAKSYPVEIAKVRVGKPSLRIQL